MLVAAFASLSGVGVGVGVQRAATTTTRLSSSSALRGRRSTTSSVSLSSLSSSLSSSSSLVVAGGALRSARWLSSWRASTPSLSGAASSSAAASSSSSDDTRSAHDERELPSKTKVVIVGCGFGGLFAARGLATVSGIDVTVVERNNYHLFAPLLYQVGCAGLAPSDIAWPVRGILGAQANTRVVMDEVVRVDRARRRVHTRTKRIAYDHLVLATGAHNTFFGRDAEWAPYAWPLKDLNDATALRSHILRCLERAEVEVDADVRRRLTTFVVIGGGPTGVELAGSLSELGRTSLGRDFRSLTPSDLHVVLVEGGDHVLSTFPRRLCRYSRRALESLGVTVTTGARVTSIDASGVNFVRTSPDATTPTTQRIESATVAWAAGVTASPVARWLDLPPSALGRSGRTRVDRFCRLAHKDNLASDDSDNIYVIGDTAEFDVALSSSSSPSPSSSSSSSSSLPSSSSSSKPAETLPGLAPVAKQQGHYVAAQIAAKVNGTWNDASAAPFKYKNLGSMATIGRHRAIADFRLFSISGLSAWLSWGVVHVAFLIGARSPLTVLIKWCYEYFKLERGSRLIFTPTWHENEEPLLERPVAGGSTTAKERLSSSTQASSSSSSSSSSSTKASSSLL